MRRGIVGRRESSAYGLGRRFLDASRTVGLGRVLRVAPLWLLRREFLVLTLDLGAPVPDVPGPAGLRWTSLGPDDVGRVHALDPSLRIGEIRDRLADGQACLLGWIEGALVHYRWYAERDTYLSYLDARVRLGPGDLLCVASFTHRACRDRGVSSASLARVVTVARQAGLRRVISLIAWWNTPSLRVHARLGATVVGRVTRPMLGRPGRYAIDGAVAIDDDGLRVRAETGR